MTSAHTVGLSFARLIDNDLRSALRNPQVPIDLSLGQGILGLVVFLRVVAKYTGDQSFSATADACCDVLRQNEISDASVAAGASGLLLATAIAGIDVFPVAAQTVVGATVGVRAANLIADTEQQLECSTQYDFLYGYSGMVYALGLLGVLEPRLRRSFTRRLNMPLRYWCARGFHRGQDIRSINLGIGHGLPGALAALLAVSPRDPATALLAYTIDEQCRFGARGPFWPAHRTQSGFLLGRTAWCYGTPGTALLLCFAADALGDHALRVRCEDAFMQFAVSDFEAWDLSGLGMCHGLASCVSLFALAEKVMPHRRIGRTTKMLVRALLTRLQRLMSEPMLPAEVNRGLFEGAAGTALALLTAEYVTGTEWLSCFGFPTLKKGR